MKYFNRSSLRFILGFLSIVAVSLLLMVATSAYASEVDKIVFTTEEQALSVGTISEAITIQTQDSSGVMTETPETIDLQFISNSPTGEFLNSSGNPVSKTMSKNTANRTFYYRDISEGSFLITVKAIGRETGKAWEASQSIVIGASIGVSDNEQADKINTPSASSGSVSSGLNTGSSVSGTIEVAALGDKVAAPGSPLIFQAQVKKNSTKSNLVFDWSFGDGSVGRGEVVHHVYKYSGTYLVVLNAKAGNSFATSRIKVVVGEPQLSISVSDNFIEITNKSSSEIDLFNWKVTKGNKSFIFQPDTIVLPNSSIKIDNSLLTMTSSLDEGVILKDYSGVIVARNSPNLPILYEIMPENYPKKLAVKKDDIKEEKTQAPAVAEESAVINADLQTAIIFEAAKEESLWKKAWRFVTSMLE